MNIDYILHLSYTNSAKVEYEYRIDWYLRMKRQIYMDRRSCHSMTKSTTAWKMFSLPCSLFTVNTLFLYLYSGGSALVKASITFDISFINIQDESARTTTETKSTAQCGAKCMNNSDDCKAFTYNALGNGSFHLYQHIITHNDMGTGVFAVSVPQTQTTKVQLGLLMFFYNKRPLKISWHVNQVPKLCIPLTIGMTILELEEYKNRCSSFQFCFSTHLSCLYVDRTRDTCKDVKLCCIFAWKFCYWWSVQWHQQFCCNKTWIFPLDTNQPGQVWEHHRCKDMEFMPAARWEI